MLTQLGGSVITRRLMTITGELVLFSSIHHILTEKKQNTEFPTCCTYFYTAEGSVYTCYMLNSIA